MLKTAILLGTILVVTITILFVQSIEPSYAKEKYHNGDRNWSRDKVKRYIRIKFAGEGEKRIKQVIAVFEAESHLKCNKTSTTDDVGVAQINKIHWKRFGGKERLKGCKENIDAAYTIYKEWGRSLRPWSAYNNGSYKRYL